MSANLKPIVYFAIMAALLALVGFGQSWSVALSILNLCLVSAIMALGVNMQWGYAGLFNVGVMGFAALGGMAAILVAKPPVPAAWAAGGWSIIAALLTVLATAAVLWFLYRRMTKGLLRTLAFIAAVLIGLIVFRGFLDPAVKAIEAVDPSRTGYLGGLGLPILLAWPIGGLFAAGAAWIVGKVALGLRSDYLAIATLGIAEITIAILKNEDWLTRGVKNVTGLPRPVPYEVNLAQSPWMIDLADRYGMSADLAASLAVKLCYTGLFVVVLVIVMVLAERALNSPWVGGSGNNWGAVLGGFLIWFVWIEAEPAGAWLMQALTSPLAEGNWLREHLLAGAPHMRMIFMGAILLTVMRFSPQGLIPERTARRLG